MKKKLLTPFLLGLTFVMTACSNPGNNNDNPGGDNNNNNNEQNEVVTKSEVSLEDALNLLADSTDSLYRKEVLNSSEVSFKEVSNNDDSTITTSEGKMEIYNDERTSETGSQKISYEDGTTYEDSYVRYLGIEETEGGEKYIERVTDYKDGTKREDWSDSTYRMPILETEDPDLVEGEEYLLEGSAPGQLTYQVSLYIYNFIAGNLVNNTDLAIASLPDIKVEEHTFKDGSSPNYTSYVFDIFSYNYEEEGDTITNGYEFSFTLDSEKRLTNAETILYYTQERGEEVYKETTTNNYEIKYDTRKASSSSSTLLNPSDYYLSEVNEVGGYYNNSLGKKVLLDNLKELPLNRYVWFEATSYKPEKAIDLKLTPIATSNENVIEINSENVLTVGPGRATITFETVNGIQLVKDVTVVDYIDIESISYSDASSGVEYGEDENGNDARFIYTETTYTGIKVSGIPSDSLKSDIKYEITEGKDLIELTDRSTSASYYDFELKVNAQEAGGKVTIKFTYTGDESIFYEVTYIIKKRLTVDELFAKLEHSTFKWESLYDKGAGAILTFTGINTFSIEYFGDITNKADLLGTSTYSFSINEEDFTIGSITRNGGDYESASGDYNGGEIRFDGEQLTLRVNDVDTVHYFYIVE